MSAKSYWTRRGGPPKQFSRDGARPVSRRSTRFPRLVLVAGVVLAATLPLIALFDFQRVTPNPLSQNGAASQAVSITYSYTASKPKASGFGIRVHFDSTRLTYNPAPNVGITNLLVPSEDEGPDFTFGPSSPQLDNGNEDADNSTDTVVLIAWAHTGANDGGFPGTIPRNLFTINFTTKANFAATTRVNISAIDTAQGFEFQGQSALIVAPGAPTPTPLPPTPTPTPVPGGDFAIIDIDRDGQVQTFSDGLLIFRYLASFRGSDLTNDAVDTVNCENCTAEEIEAYIAYIRPQLDIDLNNQVSTFSDGLLIFRYLASFRGTDLTNDAVALGTCNRCTAVVIEPYILGLRTP